MSFCLLEISSRNSILIEIYVFQILLNFRATVFFIFQTFSKRTNLKKKKLKFEKGYRVNSSRGEDSHASY